MLTRGAMVAEETEERLWLVKLERGGRFLLFGIGFEFEFTFSDDGILTAWRFDVVETAGPDEPRLFRWVLSADIAERWWIKGLIFSL